MKILALETSTQHGGAALLIDGRVAAQETTDRQRSHSELLHVFIDRCLERAGLRLSDLDAFAVGQGPGSFTGIRVAANAGKALSFFHGKPLIAVDSLTQIAFQTSDKTRPVLSLLNAHKNMLYYGLFDCSGEEPRPLVEPSVGTVEALEALIRDKAGTDVTATFTVAGDGYSVYEGDFPDSLRSRLRRESSPKDFPSPEALALLAEKKFQQGRVLGRVFDWKSYVPLYLRASEAEENKRGALMKDAGHGKTGF